jgi:pimeloyl-ACP methyl ester carboxylesterase
MTVVRTTSEWTAPATTEAARAPIFRLARILAASDVYQAMTQSRPHRPARAPEQPAEGTEDNGKVESAGLRVRRDVRAVVELLQAGEMEAAARCFVDTVAFGPGAWDTLPQSIRDTFIRNAPTFLDETNDPEGVTIDLSSLRSFEKPALVTTGTASPPFFGPIAEIVAQALPMSTLRRIDAAGHVPHVSHPELYVELIRHYCEHPGGEPPATSARAI